MTSTASETVATGDLRLSERMRKHVISRLPGKEPAIKNGAWQMMLDAADLIDDLCMTLKAAEADIVFDLEECGYNESDIEDHLLVMQIRGILERAGANG